MLSVAYPTAKGRAIGIYNAAIHIGLTIGPIVGLLVAPDGSGDWPFLIFALLGLFSGVIVLFFLRVDPVRRRTSNASLRHVLVLLVQARPAVLLVGVLIYGAGYGVFLSVLPISLTLSHGFDSRGVSLLFVLFYAAVSLSQIVAGTVSDRIGGHGFLVWGMAFAAAGLSSLPLSPGLWAYFPLAVASIGLGAFCVASIATLNDCVSDELKGAVSGAYYFFWGAGYVLGPLAIAVLTALDPLIAYLCLSGVFAALAVVLHIVWKIRLGPDRGSV